MSVPLILGVSGLIVGAIIAIVLSPVLRARTLTIISAIVSPPTRIPTTLPTSSHRTRRKKGSPPRSGQGLVRVTLPLHLQHRYEIQDLLGEGSFGRVYKVRDKVSGEIFALKQILPDHHHSQAREFRGIVLCAFVRHRAFVPIHFGWWSEVDGLCYVMPVADETVESLLQKSPRGLPPAEIVAILHLPAEGLDHLHAQGGLHRDVKPANLLVFGPYVVLADYSVARAYDRGGGLTIAGTRGYMAPEAWRGQAVPASDQYSLAVTYIHLRLGQVPSDPLIPAGRLPSAEEAVLHRALDPNPTRRWKSCVEFLVELKRAIWQVENA